MSITMKHLQSMFLFKVEVFCDLRSEEAGEVRATGEVVALHQLLSDGSSTGFVPSLEDYDFRVVG